MAAVGGRRPGSGRKRLDPEQRMLTVAFAARGPDIVRYDEAAYKEGLTRSAWIRKALSVVLGKKGKV